MPHDMMWVVFSLIAPMFWAVSNIIDQYLLRDTFDNAPWRYTLFQGAFYLPLVLVFPFVFPAIRDTSWHDALMLMVIGTTWIPAVGFYMCALKGDDASVAVPLFNIVPFFILIGGWLFLGETISLHQALAGSVLVLAAAAITWDFSAKRLRVKTILFMLASCTQYATYSLVARHQIATMHWAAVYFWYSLGFSLCCVAVTIFLPKNRKLFLSFLTKKSKKAIYLSIGQSWLDVLAISCITIAIAKAPALPLVSFVSSLQPLYVTVAGGIAACYQPHVFEKLRLNKILVWKIGCIAVMLIALYVLLVAA